MPGTINDLLKFFDHMGITIDDPTILESAFIRFQGDNVIFGGEFKSGSVTRPEGMKGMNLNWTQTDGE